VSQPFETLLGDLRRGGLDRFRDRWHKCSTYLKKIGALLSLLLSNLPPARLESGRRTQTHKLLILQGFSCLFSELPFIFASAKQ
jgi:hypothetical protein